MIVDDDIADIIADRTQEVLNVVWPLGKKHSIESLLGNQLVLLAGIQSLLELLVASR